MFVLLQ